MIESFFIFQVTDRRKMVALKLLDDFLWVTHFLLIGGYTAAMTTGIAVFREIIFYFKDEKRWAKSLWWAIGFSLAFAACVPITWVDIFSIFPALASIVSTWVFWVDKTEVGKLIQLPSAICMFAYSIVCSSYSSILTQIITITSIVLFFARSIKRKVKNKKGVQK
ncbi:MAG: YgjV family protein [Clostridia bacterium]|nr:YgjV family protein [Clostridia bacterium]